MSILAKKLKELRDKKNISQTELGYEVTLSRFYINRIENGYMIPSVSIIKRFADFYNLPHVDLIELAREDKLNGYKKKIERDYQI